MFEGLFAIGFALVVLGGIWTVSVVRQNRRLRYLASVGVKARARVDDSHHEIGEKGERTGRGVAMVSFVDVGGNQVEARLRTNSKLKIGKRIDIVYDPDRPTRIAKVPYGGDGLMRVDDDPPWFAYAVLATGVLFVLAAMIFAVVEGAVQ